MNWPDRIEQLSRKERRAFMITFIIIVILLFILILFFINRGSSTTFAINHNYSVTSEEYSFRYEFSGVTDASVPESLVIGTLKLEGHLPGFSEQNLELDVYMDTEFYYFSVINIDDSILDNSGSFFATEGKYFKVRRDIVEDWLLETTGLAIDEFKLYDLIYMQTSVVGLEHEKDYSAGSSMIEGINYNCHSLLSVVDDIEVTGRSCVSNNRHLIVELATSNPEFKSTTATSLSVAPTTSQRIAIKPIDAFDVSEILVLPSTSAL